MKKELKLWCNGEIKYFINTETGTVRMEEHYPCAEPGRNFMKPMHDVIEIGSIGQDGVKYIQQKIQEAKAKGYKPHTGYDGWASDLDPFWNRMKTRLFPK